MWTRRDFLKLGVCVLTPSWLHAFAEPTDAMPDRPGPATGVVVLDDCDPNYKGKATYEDNLSVFDGAGKLVARISGLNICEEIGSPHRIAVDTAACRIWVTETVGHRLLQYDFAGREVLSVPDIQASAVAVDPATHNVWVARSTGKIGRGSIEVYDPKGKFLAAREGRGFDLIYDPHGKAFWAAEKDLWKIALSGAVLAVKSIAGWCSSSLACDLGTGRIWVTTRRHPQVGGKDVLLGFNNDGQHLQTTDLEGTMPFRVAVDATDGAVWVANKNKSLLLFTAAGKLQAEHPIPALTAEVEARTGNAWVATPEEVLKINRKGEILSRAQHQGTTNQAWIAAF